MSLTEQIDLPPWLSEAASHLVETAELVFPGPEPKKGPIPGKRAGRGPIRKQWVKARLKELLRNHDIGFIPNWIETPVEDGIIDLVIEAVFGLTWFAKK